MTDTLRSLSSLQTLLADNTSGAISPQDLRDMLVSVYPVTAVKAANETVNNSATLQDDDDLTFAIGANETWTFEIWLVVQSNAAADFRFTVSRPAGATYKAATHPQWNISTMGFSASYLITADNNARGTDFDESSSKVAIFFKGVIINGATAGDVTLQWAQWSANQSDTIVEAGSHLIARRLA